VISSERPLTGLPTSNVQGGSFAATWNRLQNPVFSGQSNFAIPPVVYLEMFHAKLVFFFGKKF
jgi:hypothetical protein